MCAVVDTAMLNRRATCASALPTKNRISWQKHDFLRGPRIFLQVFYQNSCICAKFVVLRHAPSLNKFRVGSPPLRSVDYWEFSLRTYSRILRGICATAGVFSSSLTALGLNVPIGRFYASINAPYSHLIHKISFYWTKKYPNVCICAKFVVPLQQIFNFRK